MRELSRRRFLGYSGLLGAGLVVAGCGDDDGQGAGASGKLTMLDPWEPERELMESWCETWAADNGIQVEHVLMNAGEIGEALALQRQSNQLPDLFTLFGLELPPRALIDDGWFSPMTNGDEVLELVPDGLMFEGLHVFDGDVYSLPLFNPKIMRAFTWYNTELLAAADLDPESVDTSYDGFRAACAQIKRSSGSDAGALALALKDPGGLEVVVDNLVMAAGFDGIGGLDLKTGEYRFETEPFVTAIEFLMSLQQDGYLFPASSGLDAKTARARWASGEFPFLLDGQFTIGTVAADYEAFIDSVGLADVLTPEAGAPIVTHQPPKGAVYWIAHDTDHPEQASELSASLATREFQQQWGEQMGTMPIYEDLVPELDVHPLFKLALEKIIAQVFVAPSPVVRTVEIADVDAEMRPPQFTLGAIAQGAITGQMPDWQKALEDLSDNRTEERENAIKAAGSKVTPDDWAFPDWDPTRDFTPDLYG
ncbi:ABC transporter substrate-binding protein [Jiangella asiatica]|nr:ABC transporter substrate-binding protein [Jiangella asiatica]